ncbi:tetratricopeptide repeat protein [Calothrix sp. FACHB-1219]|uniref:tetratricopeptide repeat protein n=1 Tax=unclassified Calothrix TaxID=2619626 RepID=UPI00168201E9|nr:MULTISPECIES: tetratricopeptide repeat protein [unclassified Calothrix]MBD2206595.1 tetratricopeptide repeat protein [Calothrix sp. FACHB-168]MBD2221390.1 tetratricopeptide repeat protein [Calothrix sp. FACHB-1219]
MSNRLKYVTFTALLLSLSASVALAVNPLVVKHTLAQVASSADSKAEADKLFQEGLQQYRFGEYPKALQTYQRVLEIRRKLGDKAGVGQTLNNIGQVYNGLLQQDKALEVLQEALTIRREIKDHAGEGETLDNIGGVYLALFKEEEALKTLQQALEIRREVKDKAGEAVTLSRMGFTYTFLKQQDKGLKLLQQALVMHQELGDKFQEGFTLFRIGVAYDNINDYPNALDWLNKALAVNREIGNRAWEGRSLLQIGLIYFYTKEYDNALKFFQQSLPIIQAAGIRYSEASILATIGDSYFIQQKYDEAIKFYQKALPIARELKRKSLESEVLTSLGDCYRRQEKYDIALEVYQQALPLMREVKNKPEEGRILFLIGTIYNLQGKSEQALENLQKSLPIAREIKNQTLKAKILAEIGHTYFIQKQFDRAIEFYQQALALERQPLNNRVVQLDILTQIMLLYGLSASEAGRKKDYTRAITQENQKLNLVAEALNIARELKDSAAAKEVMRIQSQAYSSIGYYYLNLQELQKAQDFIQQGLTIARQSGNLKAERYALSYLGGVYMAQGDNTKVIEVGKQELEIARLLKDPILEVGVLLGLANTYNLLGDYEQGIQFSQQALTKAEEIDIQKLPEHLQEYALGRKPSALGTLSLIYTNLGEYDKALEFAQKSLNLVRSLKKPKLEAKALIDIGSVYNTSQDFQKAIEFTQQALKIAREIKNTDLEAEALKKLSAAYTGKGDYQQALDSAQQILVIAEKTQNLNLKIDALDIQRQIYTNQGNYQKTLELFQEALKVAKQDNNPYYEWLKLLELGAFYNSLGDYQKNIEYLQQALSLAKKMQNPQFEGTTLFVLAYSYFGKGEPQKTIEFANQGLAILPKTKTISLEIIGNLVLSLGYGELNNEQKAIEAAQASLALVRKGKNPNDEKTVLTVLGNLQRKFGKKQEAIQTYNQALAIKTQAKTVGTDSGIYAGLGRVYADLNQPNTAIPYYKEAINRIEEVRRGIKLLTPELQASFLQTTVDFGSVKTEDIYRQLADLLSSQGREAEAQQVMELLKIQELNNFARETTGTSKITNLELSNTEKQIITKHGTLIAFGNQLAECKKNKCSQLSNLITQHRQLTEEFNSLIENLKNPKNSEVDKSRIKDVYDRTDDLIASAEKILAAPKQPDGTVLIYPLVLKDKVRILWAAKGGVLSSKVCQIGESELTKDVSNFRRLLQQPDSDITQVKATGKKLYDCLIKPIESELKANKVKHLVFVPDRAINYIPMAALFDGEKYLIENYSVVSVLNAGLTDAKDTLPPQIQDTQVLGLGLSNQAKTPDGTFSALNYVPIELDAIVKQKPNDSTGIYPGTKFLNQAFTRDALENNLDGRNILHIATHGLFKADNPEKSYILLGTGVPYPITQIKHLQKLREIHLVVLSACETALGGSDQNGIEIQGMSAYFLRDKAKSVMASLWVVSDRSTAQLMQQFYSNLANSANSKTRITKAEALRQAQLSLLNSNKSTGENTGNSRGIFELINPDISSRHENNTSGYSHPYYWAPFILIGNGL